MAKIKCKDLDIKEVIKNYYKIKSVHKVGKLYGLSGNTIYKYLNTNGVSTNNSRRKYNCNDNYFDKNTQESFYWAGFIAADGCVMRRGKNSKILSISIHTKDIDHLYKFKKAIGFAGPINS